MKLTRREFLAMAGRLGAAMPFLFAYSACSPALTAVDPETGLSLDCVVGDVTSSEAVVWLRAEMVARVGIQYGKDPNLNQFNATEPIPVEKDADNTLRIQLKGLTPKTVYYYRAHVEDKKPGAIGRFVTAPAADDPGVVQFCFSADTRESYKPFVIMDAIRAQRPDFFLHLGDTIYADKGWAAHTLEEFWAKYRANREDAASQLCFRETSWYVVWDDHEVEDNYLPGNPLAPVGRRAFLDYWPIRRNPDDPERIYRSFRWGQALELFILDARQYRNPKKGTMLGEEQKKWLMEGLSSSSALFKFVGTSVVMYGGGSDRWDGYPKERTELLRFIGGEKLRGVVFLSGDLHYAAVSLIPRGKGVKEITAGPLAAPMNVITNGTAKRFEFFSNKTFNFAKITVDPMLQPAYALVEFFDERNNLMYHTTINA
ncbi:MAG TPA: alkaline phosphatase D family protein [Candidatus Acidoferrales bacterium]|nr:alkaline phosphatase D family protein [Candidatus Acidoferrales bacterium]